MDAVESSQAILFGKRAGCSAQRIGGVEREKRRPLPFKRTLGRPEIGYRERFLASKSGERSVCFSVGDDRRGHDGGIVDELANMV